MLSNNGEKYSQCPCCKACADCSESKEAVDIQSACIIHKKQTQLNRIIEPEKKTSTDDIFLLQQSQDVNMAMFDRVSEQDLQNIDCPRCKYIIEHAGKHVGATGRVEEKALIGVCDHCRNKNNQPISCYEYEDVIKKLIAGQSVNTDDFKEKPRKWTAKVNRLYKNVARIDTQMADTKMECPTHIKKQSKKLQETSYRDLAFRKVDDLKDKIRSKPISEIEKDYMNISKSNPNLRTLYRTQSNDSYLQRLENIKNLTGTMNSGKLYGSKPESIMSPVHQGNGPYLSDDKHIRKPDYQAVFDKQDFDTYHQPDKKYSSKPDQPLLRETRDFDPFYSSDKKYINKDDVKKLLDTQYYDDREGKNYKPKFRPKEVKTVNDSTPYAGRLEKEFLMPFEKNKSLQQIYLKRHSPDVKNLINIGEENDKRHPSKSVRLTLRDISVLSESIYQTRSETSMLDLKKSFLPKSIFKSETQLYSERKPKIDIMKSHNYIEHYVSSTLPIQKIGEEKKYTGYTPVYSSPNKKYPSEEALSTQSEFILKSDFSYQFPKEIIAKKELKHLRTSAELIQETQAMLNAREEEKKQRIENERTRKLLEQEINNKTREEKKRLQEEKRKEEEEQRRKSTEEKKKIEEENRRIEEERRKQEEKQNAHAEKRKEEGDILKTKKKPNTELTEENKLNTKAEKERMKTEREKAIEEKKAALEEKRKETEISREKAKSDKVNKEKEKADKEADKLNKQKEKEIQLRMQKEEKQREKDEKERLKKEKEEQQRAEKARMQGEKEEEQKNIRTSNKKDKSDDLKSSVPESKQPKSQTPKDQEEEKVATEKDFKKIRDEFDNKDEALKRKKEAQLEKNARDEADKKEKEIEKQGQIHGKEAKAKVKPEAVKGIIKVVEKTEVPTIKELDIKQVKVRKPSYDDLILRLVKLKQSEPRERVKQKPIPVLDVPEAAREHKKHKYTKASKCLMCVDSEFELDVESVLMKTEQLVEASKDIIIGQKILKYKPPLVDKEDKTMVIPTLFQSTFQAESPIEIKKQTETIIKEEPEFKSIISAPAKSQKMTEQEAPKGIIRYALSDRTFIEKGWTMLPTEKVVRKMNVYRMRPAHPEFDWFEHNKKKKLMLYDTGEKLADFDDKGRSRIYYRNGRLALDYYDAEEINAQQRFVVFSSGELDERGRTYPITILATFDYLGNGIVFDHGGKIRLKYNQTEGVVLDRGIGPVSHWKWHTLNDPPVLQKVMIDTQMAHKDPDIYKMGGSTDGKSRPDNEEMLAIEFDNFIKEKSKKLTQTFKPFQIKMKALKINDNFSLKILDQATIYLIFRDGSTNVKLNLGMILDHKEIVDTDTAEVGEVSNSLERFPARTESLAGLQRSVAYAQRFERARIERERRLRPPEPCTSADQLTAAATRPLRLPLNTVRSSSTADASSCKCNRKPCSSNVYYDTRLI